MEEVVGCVERNGVYEMEEKYTDLAVHLESVDARCKSNEHRIDDHDNEIKELREKQDAIYDLTSSVKSIATDMTYIKEDVKEVKSGQAILNDKVTVLENRPAQETKKRVDSIYIELLKMFIIGVAGFLLAQALPGIF